MANMHAQPHRRYEMLGMSRNDAAKSLVVLHLNNDMAAHLPFHRFMKELCLENVTECSSYFYFFLYFVQLISFFL